MRIAIVSEESHVNSHKRALEARGHEVVLLGGHATKIPPSVEVVVLRTVGCSHNASDTALAWGRSGKGHLIVEDGVAMTIAALSEYERKNDAAAPVEGVTLASMTEDQFAKLSKRLDRAMSGEEPVVQRGTLVVVGGRPRELDLIDTVAKVAGLRRVANIAGTARTIPETVVRDNSLVVVAEHRVGSTLARVASELCERLVKPIVGINGESTSSELLVSISNAGFPPVNLLIEAAQLITRGRHVRDCASDEQEALRHIAMGENGSSKMSSWTRRDRQAILARVVLERPAALEDEILLRALDLALTPEKMTEIHPNHIDAAREEVGVIVDEEHVPIAIHGTKMVEAASRYNVPNPNIDALPWIAEASETVATEPDPVLVTPEPIPELTPEPIPEPEPENTMPAKDSKPKKFQRVRSNGKPYSKPDEKFALCVEILREHGDLSHALMVELLTERLSAKGYVVPKRMNLPMASARIAAGIVAPVEQLPAPVPVSAPAPAPAPAPVPVSLDERVRAAVVSLQALMREARITSANLTPDSATLEVEVVTITHTTLRF